MINSSFGRICVILVALSVTIGMSPIQTVYAKSNTTTVKIKVEYGQTEARKITKMINEFRQSDDAWYWNSSNTKKIKVKNLKKLKYDYGLEKVAMQRAAEIAIRYEASHKRPDGRECNTAFSDAGYKMVNWGENIAYGYDSAESVNEGWREDDEKYDGQGHRRNMLGIVTRNPFVCVGIGHAVIDGTDFWVEEFGGKRTGVKKTQAKNGSKKVTVKVAKSRIVTDDGKKYIYCDAVSWSDEYYESENIMIPVL